ncbi:MAG: TRAP transporter small permease [Pseudomonadota bacterium]
MSLENAGRAILLVAAGILLCAMMVLTVVDVVGRYLLSAPVPGAFEATEIMLALAIFAGLPIVTARGEHVSVRLVVDHLPPWLQRGLGILGDVMVALLLAGAAWLLYRRGETLSEFGDATVLLRIPLAPVAFALMALSAVAAIVAVIRVVQPGVPRS